MGGGGEKYHFIFKRCPDSGPKLQRVQKTLTAVVRMFERVGLQTNPRKANEMVCIPDFIWGQKIEAAYNLRVTGKKGTFGERKITRVSCEEYGATM